MGRTETRRTRTILLLLCLLLTWTQIPAHAHAELNDSLWHACRYTCAGGRPNGLSELWDMNAESGFVVESPDDLTISWRNGVPARMLYLAWRTLPEPFTLTQYAGDGAVLSTCAGETWQLNSLYKLNPKARSVSVTSNFDMDLCSALVYGPGKLPEYYHPWKPTPEKLDYLIIATHPDDDVLFLGAIVPLYGVSRGLEGTIVYTATGGIRYRCDEALNGAWVMGLRNHPLFAGFPNLLPKQQYQREKDFSVEQLTAYYVSILRRYKPEVVVTHDEKGEYGHWQHINVSRAVRDAVLLAADASYDPASASEYGIFQVKKLYLHLYPEHRVTLNVDQPISAFGGRSVMDIATAAFAEHKSQVKVDHYRVSNDGFYRLSDFGLCCSTVGLDTGKNDLFEHVDAGSLSNYVPLASSVSSPTPSSAATPLPSGAPLPAPANATDGEPFVSRGDTPGRRMLLLGLTAGAVLAAAGAVILIVRMRKNR